MLVFVLAFLHVLILFFVVVVVVAAAAFCCSPVSKPRPPRELRLRVSPADVVAAAAFSAAFASFFVCLCGCLFVCLFAFLQTTATHPRSVAATLAFNLSLTAANPPQQVIADLLCQSP